MQKKIWNNPILMNTIYAKWPISSVNDNLDSFMRGNQQFKTIFLIYLNNN